LATAVNSCEPGHGARELLVDAVAQDLVARALVGRQALDELVERALGVEHHRPQLAAHLQAVAGQALGRHEGGLVAQLRQPQRVGQALRRVDGHDGHAPALGRQADGQRSGRRRLAHAAGPGADDDALALQAIGERGHYSTRASRSASVPRPSGDSTGSNRNGRVVTGARPSRRRTRQLRALDSALARGRPARRARPRRPRPRPGQRAGVGVGEAVGQQPVDHEELDRHPELGLQHALEVERLAHRHLLGPGDRDDAGPGGGR
jgi:hypothetical protein